MINFMIGHHYAGHNNRLVQTVLQTFNKMITGIMAGRIEALANGFEPMHWFILQSNVSVEQASNVKGADIVPRGRERTK